MKIAICEDDALFRISEQRLVETFFEEKNRNVTVELFEDGLFLLQAFRQGKRYDCILMDLQMRKSDGLSVIEKLRETDGNVAVVFVTGIEERATEGYRVDALAYVTKSNLEAGLMEALERFLARYDSSVLPLETEDGEYVFLAVKEILWAESENRKTKVVTDQAFYVTSSPIGKFAEGLPKGRFTEIYKGIYVQLAAVKRIGHDTVEMRDGRALPLSRRKRTRVMEEIMEQMRKGII